MFFSILLLITGYLTTLCMTPPNPPPTKSHQEDRILLLTGSFATFVRYHGIIFYSLLAYLAFYTPGKAPLCPHPENVNPTLLTWSAPVIASIIAIWIGAAVRLSAFGGLGRNFTFQIAAPDRLVTSGVYRFMQHPSYTGQALVSVGCMGLFNRWDGAMACWMSVGVREGLDGWGAFVTGGLVVFAVWVLGLRVRDEEAMLKGKFGEDWVRWHSETSRFIPGIF